MRLAITLILLVFLCGPALGQNLVKEASGSSYPKFEHALSDLGFFALYTDSTSSTANQISRLEITAVTDCSFNILGYSHTNETDTTPTSWSRISPAFLLAAPDTVLTIPAGKSAWYYFDRQRPKAIVLVSGSITIKGE